IERTLVTVDVTGAWDGTYSGVGFVRDIVLVLQQRGPRVRGEMINAGSGSGTSRNIPIEGSVDGDTFSFQQVSGQILPIRGVLHVNGDEMTGSGQANNYQIQMNLRRRPQ